MELRQYFVIARRYWWLLCLTTLLAGGAAYYFSATSPPVYQATTILEVDLGADPRQDPYSVSSVNTVERAAEIFAAKIESPVLLGEVADRLGLAMDIKPMIDVRQTAGTPFLDISAESNDPALAQALANAVAEVFIEQETQKQQARFQAGLEDLEEQIAALEAAITETQIEISSLGAPENLPSEFARLEVTRLESELTRDQTRLLVLLSSAEDFRLAMARYTDDIRVHSPANLPTVPIGQRTIQNTLLGAITGLMIGAGVAFLLEYLDDTIRTPDDVKRHLPVDVLAALPAVANNHAPLRLIVAEEPRRPISEAFRSLRTSLEFCRPDRPPRAILFTSPQPSDGKSFIAANLAAVLAQGGRSVILVDADLRNPQQDKLFDLPREPGLTDVLLLWAKGGDIRELEGGEEETWARLYPELLPPEQQRDLLQPSAVEGLRVLTSGRSAPNPAELMASRSMEALLSWLREQADMVIFDTPPVLAVTDAAVLSSRTDGTLLVVDCGQTRLPAVSQALERLLRVGENVLGVVLNRLSSSADGYYYYYAYYDQDGRGSLDGRLPTRIARRLMPRWRKRRVRQQARPGAKE